MDIAAQGVISTIDSNLPITATLHNTTLQLGGTSAPVAELPFPLELHGPIDHPGIRIDTSAVQQTLVDLGKREAARRLQEEAQKRLGIPAGEGSGNVQDAAKDAARGLLDGFLSGRKSDDAEKKQEETAPPPARP
jgi:hypothetical protein